MDPEVRMFVESYKRKKTPPVNINAFLKSHNHELWRTCKSCDYTFDMRKWGANCPKCDTKNQ